MTSMFNAYGSSSTTLGSPPNVSSWNTSSVTTMKNMFYSFGSSSTTLSSLPDVSKWDTVRVTDMSNIFNRYASSCIFDNLDLTNWKTTQDTTISAAFYSMKVKSITLGVGFSSDLTTSGAYLTNSSGKTNATWCDSSGISYDNCSMGTTARTEVVTYYDTNPCEAYGYKDTTSENDDTLVLTYDSEKETHKTSGQTVYDMPTSVSSVSSWGWYKDSSMSSYKKVTINENFKNYKGLTSAAYMFYSFKNVSNHEGFEYLDTTNVTDMTSMFNAYGSSSTTISSPPNVSSWNTTNVTKMKNMFYSFGSSSTALTNLPDVSNWTTSGVTDISNIFNKYGSTSTIFENLNLSNWKTTQDTTITTAFYSVKVKSITLGVNFNSDLTPSGAYLANRDGTPNATWYDTDGNTYVNCSMGTAARTGAVTYYDTKPILAYAYKDTTSENDDTLVITYDTEKGTHKTSGQTIYELPTSVTSVSSWAWYKDREAFTKVTINENFKDYSGLTNTAYMFYGFKNVSNHEGFEYLDTTNVTDMTSMFNAYGSSSTTLNSPPNVSSWNTTNVTKMKNMFYSFGSSSSVLSSLPKVANWTTSGVTDMSNIFNRYGSTSTVFDSLDLTNWKTTQDTTISAAFYSMKVKSITLGVGFSSDLTTSGAYLTNSSGKTNATWYDSDGNTYTNSSMGTAVRTGVVTYYDTKQSLTSETQQDKRATKTDTQQAGTKVEEAEPVLAVLLNFTSSITSFFNTLRLPFV